jgi:leucyl aminopeptidase
MTVNKSQAPQNNPTHYNYPAFSLLQVQWPHSCPIILVDQKALFALRSKENEFVRGWIKTNDFRAEPGQVLPVPDEKGALSKVFAGVADIDNVDMYAFAAIRAQLPRGHYNIENADTMDAQNLAQMALGWSLDAYDYKLRHGLKPGTPTTFLHAGEKATKEALIQAKAIYMVRDLINRPANEMTTDFLAEVAEDIMSESAALTKFNLKSRTIKGDDLLSEDYPLIHTVGRASVNKPALFDSIWDGTGGDANAPKITLVGKGVTFDTGGLGIKPGGGMRDMKKDMGGAAHVLALAQLIMTAGLPVCLRVMIPIAENSISSNAYRPGDVMHSRKSPLTAKRVAIENEHTDAEGRLIMADCLIEAASENPDLLIDFATLTGAQRVAHGLEIGGVMGTDKHMIRELEDIGETKGDWLAGLPLHQRYKSALASSVADMQQSASAPAGAITAGLFLQEFTKNAKNWLHFDVSGWNASAKPARPQGGEALGVRSMMH